MCVVSSRNSRYEEQEELKEQNKILVIFERCDDENITLEDCLNKYENEGKEILLDNGHILGWTI
jgi:hypothetical protein